MAFTICHTQRIMPEHNRDSSPESQNPNGQSQLTKTLHLYEPDYERPGFSFSPEQRERLLGRLAFLYGHEAAGPGMAELERICRVYFAHKPQALIQADQDFDPAERFSERDMILITYGDLIKGRGHSPLASLARFCENYLEGNINILHILPFFPYSSDRGFSVIDFATVDPELGTWQDIWSLESRFQLMFDGVFNHISSQSRWFQEFLGGNPYYKDFFISYDSPQELSDAQRQKIFRPRTSDILARYATVDRPKYVWTTFSRDQVDLNYKSPNVLLRVMEILLTYIRQGADIIRLDAVTYLWAELGTSCAHLDQTHEIVKLMRDVLDCIAPQVALITETNVPHDENISYFGDGRDEAQMVYNFALPPLVLHAFHRQDASWLSEWAGGLSLDSPQATFFNFLDSHDGIGLMGVKGILPPEEIEFILETTKAQGGLVSYKTGAHGEEEPYELNITWFSALNRPPEDCGEDIAFQVRRFVASRVVALVLPGVPGIYLHSMIGTRNDVEAVTVSDSKRDINRRLIDEELITATLKDPLSKVSRIGRELGRLLTIRSQQRSFHPSGRHRVLSLDHRVLAVLRSSPEGDEHTLALINVADQSFSLEIAMDEVGIHSPYWLDLVSEMDWAVSEGKLHLKLLPYDILWLQPRNEPSDDFDF